MLCKVIAVALETFQLYIGNRSQMLRDAPEEFSQ